MPQNTILCRICLATNRPIFTIADTPLQTVYEKLTNTPLNTEDLRPVVVCFICCAELKKCQKLMLTSAKAENMLTRILDRHPNATRSSKKLLTLVKRKTNGLCGSLCVTPVHCTDTLSFNTPIIIKNEPEDHQENIINNFKNEIDYDECAGSPHISQCAPGMDTDNVLNLRDCGVLRSIRMERECYGYEVKVELAEENYQEVPAVDNTKNVKEESEEILNLLKSEPYTERTNHHENHSEYTGFHVAKGVPTENLTPAKQKRNKNKLTKRYYECNECQRRFGKKNHLENHMVIHPEVCKKQSLICYICHRRLGSKASVHRHMMAHAGEKPHACHFCPSRFIEKGTLIKHIRTHTGEKPYECDVCERGFKQLNDLKRHARIHTGEKPFKCEICQRRFNERSKVTRHAKTHFGEKLTKRDFLKLFKYQ